MLVASCRSALNPTLSLYAGPVPYKELLQMQQMLLTTALGMVPRPSDCSEDCSIVDMHSNISDQLGQKSTQSSLGLKRRGGYCEDIRISTIILGQEKQLVSKKLEPETILTPRPKSPSHSLKPRVSLSMLLSKFCFPLLSILQIAFSVLMTEDG